ncbi:MAG: hypothetical protein N3A38_00620 [Planctomycetota bacterium]|nr:hypothetical protein [Planctomycetota bacterium]
MAFKYRMFNAPSPWTIERAASLGLNWVIVHSMGTRGDMDGRDPASGRRTDPFPIYFEDYPKVAEIRRNQDAVWIEPLRREVAALCDRAKSLGLKVAFHFYEIALPHVFESEYPEIVSVWRRPTQEGVKLLHSCMNPDNPATWDLMRSKYAEIARTFPQMDMAIITTWDGGGTDWCVPKAEMPIWERLARQIEAAREGVKSVRKDCTVCLRLWGRNWPSNLYRDGHSLIEKVTGLRNATEYMEPVARACNDPDVILPKVFARLPKDVPVMYKSTRMDIHDAQPLTLALGKYPKSREQIIEISYELYHQKPWPWCKVRHIRTGLEAAARHKLAGFLALPINMGNNDRAVQPETGNLGRMNTWMLERLLAGDKRSDAELVTEWLQKEYGAPQPKIAVDLLLEADGLVDKGLQWGNAVWVRAPFASLHTMKLYWMYDGFVDPDFPYEMADPKRETIERLIEVKHKAHDRARECLAAIEAARGAMHPDLYRELSTGFSTLAQYISLARDWQSYVLMQYGIERGLYEPNRVNLGRMSRYAENFIRNLVVLRDTPAGKMAIGKLSFPDPFPLT